MHDGTRTTIALLAIAAIVPAAVGADSVETRLDRLERLLESDTVREGAKIFARACAACHGGAGHGDGPAADQLRPPPRDLTTRRFRFRSTPSGAAPTPADLERTIRRGLPGTAMPGFGELFSAREIAALVAFLASIREDSGAIPAPLPTHESVLSDDAGTIAAGKAIYVLSGCASCHGERGDGRGPAAATLVDELGRPMAMPDLRFDPLKGGRTVAAVVRTLRTGLNGAPMPSYDEAMLFGAEDLRSLEDSMRAALPDAPTRDGIATLDEERRAALRDRRLESLARYVLSLDRRRGTLVRLFRVEPEREAREP